MEQRLNRKLLDYKKEDIYPLHMPGHKRNIVKACTHEDSFGSRLSDIYDIDITEIDGFDNLHDAKDLIKDAEDRAAKLYKAEESHFLVNGSTCGILAAISAVAEKGRKIIVSRNCHISVYNAIELNELVPVYIYPEVIDIEDINSGIAGSIDMSSVERAIINNPDACALVITSPTYDGVLSNVSGIAKVAHEYDIPLIVDEAHGALFFIEGRSALINGADIVINSLHKTLPSLTQTALLHINGKIVDRQRVRKYLRIYQTSSPSYVLMASIDYAVELMEEQGKGLYRDFCIRTTRLKDKLSRLRNIRYIEKDKLLTLGAFDFDESKVLISVGNSGLTGKDLYNILIKKYKIQPEMAAGDYVLLMTTLFDSDEGINRLINALYEIDEKCLNKQYFTGLISDEADEPNNFYEFGDSDNKLYLEKLMGAIDALSEMTVFVYPPGIPIIVAGEVITDSMLSEVEKAVKNKLDIKWIEN